MTPFTTSRRRILAGMLSVAGLGVLQACSSSTPSAAPPVTQAAPTAAPTQPLAAPTAAPTQPVAAPTAAPTAAPAATAAPQGAVKATLRFSHWWGDQFAHYIPTMQQKTGIAIQEERNPYNGYFQKILTQLVAGTGPDLIEIDANENGNFFTSGTLVPFNDYLKSRSDVDPAKWNADPLKENGYQGKILGLSLFTMQDLIVHVNQELADKDGLLKDAPLWGTPGYDTWHLQDKFVEWLKAGTKVKSDGTVDQYGLSGNLGGWHQAMVYMWGGTLFDEDWGYDETKSMVDSDPFVNAMQYAADLVLKHKVSPLPADEKAIQGGMYLAKRALASVTWSTPSIYPEENTFKQTQIHLPFGDHKIHAFGANYISVNKVSKLQDAGFEWTTTFCVDKDVRALFLQVSSVPAYDPLPIVQASPEGRPKTIGLMNLSRIKGMSSVPTDTDNVAVYPRWYGLKAPQFTRDTLAAAFDSVLAGKSVKDAYTDAAKKINAELAKKR